jgi:ethanolamine ammonia-lyase small subunit
MMHDRDDRLASAWPEIVQKIRAKTPARLLEGRVGVGYRTSTQMELRVAHAAARDAVRLGLDLERDFGAAFIRKWDLFEVCTQAETKDEYLLRPDLGRQLSVASRDRLLQRCSTGNDLQIIVGDGLSVTAVSAQVPALLEFLHAGGTARGWSMGQPFVVRHCRVGVLNEVGELLRPRVAILLIGERPGLATAESLSAYLAYQPRMTHTDADRNLISNIHQRGVITDQAAVRILNLAGQMMATRSSGCQLREQFPPLTDSSC